MLNEQVVLIHITVHMHHKQKKYDTVHKCHCVGLQQNITATTNAHHIIISLFFRNGKKDPFCIFITHY